MMDFDKHKFKKNEFDTCNICGQYKKMSYDHVPPHGGLSFSSVEIATIFQNLKHENPKKILSQNGIKYRTICEECNKFIGTRYDSELNRFSKNVGLFLKSNLILPETFLFNCKPNLIIRAILAHLVAARIGLASKFDQDVIECIRDSNKPIPDNIFVYYGIYPFSRVRVLRDFLLILNSQQMPYCQVLKYFPIAYIITDKPCFDLPIFPNYKRLNPLDSIEISIRRKAVIEEGWPEQGYFPLLIGQSSLASADAIPRLRRRKKKSK